MELESLTDAKQVFAGIKARARESGITIADLCRKAGVSKYTLDSWNADRRHPSIPSLIKINSALRQIEGKKHGRSHNEQDR